MLPFACMSGQAKVQASSVEPQYHRQYDTRTGQAAAGLSANECVMTALCGM